jgi:tRNA (guanine37-N1)-methyltransferase
MIFPNISLFLQGKSQFAFKRFPTNSTMSGKLNNLTKRLKALFSEILPAKELSNVYNSYDIVGNIAIIRLKEETKKHAKRIAEVLMSTHSNVKTVLTQTDGVSGKFRLRKLSHVAGEKKTSTIHRESECLFSVDVKKCYFSPRLLHERIRIAQQIKGGEVVVNMFAGVGCFSILIAKYAKPKKVYSIDVNPTAVEYMKENIRMNHEFDKVIPILGDAKKVIKENLRHKADRVLMPLPEKALAYIPFALLALPKRGGWINYYGFEHAGKNEDPVEKAKLKVSKKLRKLGVAFSVSSGRVVRATGPNWYQIGLDIKILGASHFVGFDDTR